MNREVILRRRIKLLTWFFIVGLVISGATAIPLLTELNLLTRWFGLEGQASATATSELGRWLLMAHEALQDTAAKHPLLFYGTDWLAFGHFVIAVAFVGALRDPVRNRWFVRLWLDRLRHGDSLRASIRRGARNPGLVAAG